VSDDLDRVIAVLADFDPVAAPHMARALAEAGLLSRSHVPHQGLVDDIRYTSWICCDGNVVDGRKQHVPGCAK
jgi:plasmid stabilization system protein ParE